MPTIATKSAAASVDLTAPGPIGGTTPAAVTATALTATGNLTVDTDTLFVDATNNRVGLGTNAPLASMHIVGVYSPGNTLQIGEPGYGSTYGMVFRIYPQTGSYRFYGLSNSVLSPTPWLTLQRNTGNVLINTATDDQVTKLQVAGGAAFAGPVSLPSYTTATRPTYGAGKVIFDTTLGKLCIGGAAAWEVVTSS